LRLSTTAKWAHLGDRPDTFVPDDPRRPLAANSDTYAGRYLDPTP
jgi:hypothetical protein